MKIKDRAEFRTKPAPLTARRGETVLEAAQRMAERNFGSIIVVNDDGTIAGMVTERDMFKRVIADRRDPEKTTVEDVMTKNVRTASEEDDLLDWLRIMSNERFRRLPIVDSEGKLSSVMSQGDFVSYTWPQLFEQAKTLAKSTVGSNYQIFYILGGILLYTVLLVFALAIAT
ncbi:MAG: CBS domain-containing protein [Pseudomonadota bacterium]